LLQPVLSGERTTNVKNKWQAMLETLKRAEA